MIKFKQIDLGLTISITIFLLINFTVTMCSSEVWHNLNDPKTYQKAQKYYENKYCAKLSCDEPDTYCMEYCYLKENDK